jgi:hypothetical protein
MVNDALNPTALAEAAGVPTFSDDRIEVALAIV